MIVAAARADAIALGVPDEALDGLRDQVRPDLAQRAHLFATADGKLGAGDRISELDVITALAVHIIFYRLGGADVSRV